MTSAWMLGATLGVPQNQDQVRSTIEPVRTDVTTVEAAAAPVMNEFDSDESGELVGLTPRMIGPHVIDSEQFVPFWLDPASAPRNIIVDRQVASSGHSAALEVEGKSGHGTLQYEESLTPEIRDGAAFGNDYFVSNSLDAMEGAGAYMTPPDQDNWSTKVLQDTANSSSRLSYQSSQFNDWLTSTTGVTS